MEQGGRAGMVGSFSKQTLPATPKDRFGQPHSLSRLPISKLRFHRAYKFLQRLTSQFSIKGSQATLQQFAEFSAILATRPFEELRP